MTIKDWFKSNELMGSYMLLMFLLLQLFVIAIFPPNWHDLLYNILATFIYFTLVFVINHQRSLLLGFILSLILLEWISYVLGMNIINQIVFVFNILLFVVVIVKFIMQIIQSKTVDVLIILQSINGYLLMGVLSGVLIRFIIKANPMAFSFPEGDLIMNGISLLSRAQYLGLVTLSTLGYGDIIPLSPIARSVSTFIAVIGQLYVAIIIALLVGKFSGSSSSE